jgi:hypothetical protein
MLKNLPESAIKTLTLIINATLSFSLFPDRWKVVTVIFLPKLKNPSLNPADYRPVSLLSCAGKVAEAVILRRLQKYVNKTISSLKTNLGSEGAIQLRSNS